MKRNWNENVTT